MTEPQDERLGLPSASAWRRYELCAGSWALEGEAQRLNQLAHETSLAARRGTRIHAYLAGELYDGEPIELDEEEQQTADFLQERMQGEAARIFGDQPVQQLNEKRLWLVLNGQKIASGRFDRVVYTDTVALLQDAKTGWAEPIKAEQNSQLKFLAVLVALHMPQTLQEVVAQICSGPYGITEARYDRAALAKAWDEIVGTLKAIQAPDAPLAPGVEQCRYCAAINVCPAVKALVPTMKEVEALPDGDRGAQLLDEVEVLQKRLDAIREYYHERLSEDPAFELPGWGLAPGSQRREVANWKAAKARLEEFVGAAELEQLANYSIPSVEKLIAKALKLKPKEAGVKLAEILGDLLTVRQGNLCLRRTKGEAKVVSVQLP